MAIELVTQYLPYVDELFTTESKKSLLTNQDLNWTGAHTVKVYKVTTASMTDYGRTGPASGNWSRYGTVQGLDATTEEFTLKKTVLLPLLLISWIRTRQEISLQQLLPWQDR